MSNEHLINFKPAQFDFAGNGPCVRTIFNPSQDQIEEAAKRDGEAELLDGSRVKLGAPNVS